MSRESLALRAARYFGMERDTRISVPVGRGMTAVVATRMGRKTLAVHVEQHYYEHGVYLHLTERQRCALIEALGGSPAPAIDIEREGR